MPTILTCPSCKKRSQVANQPPGSAVRCPHCSAVMKVPGETSRVTPPAPSVPSSPPVAPPPQVPRLLPSLDEEVSVQPVGYVCSVCGKSFPIDQVYDLDGLNICEACHAAQTVDPGFPTAPDPGSFPVVPSLSTLMSQPPTPDAAPSSFDEPVPTDDALPPTEESVAPEEHATQIAVDDAQLSEATDNDVVDLHDTVADIGPVSTAQLSKGRRPAARRNLVPLLIGCAIAVFFLGAFLTYYLTRYGLPKAQQPAVVSAPSAPQAPADVADQAMSEWEKRNDPKLSQWRSTAKGMEISGDLAGAQLLYQKMLALAGSPGASVQSPAALAMLAEAQTSFDAITKKIGAPPPLVAMVPQNGTPATSPAVAPDQTPPAAPSPVPAATGPSASAPPATAPVAEAPPLEWEPAHKNQLLQLSADAAALEKAQQPVAALAKLEELLQTVGDHRSTLTDPQLKAAVAAADESFKRLALANRDSDQLRALTARSLVAGGLKAEREKKWKTGLEMLSDASHLLSPLLRPVQRYRDPTYLTALDGMAVAEMNLKQYQRAGELFADDGPLGRGSLVMNSPSRDLIWNRAVNDLTQKFNIMRSVKMLHDYMDAHSDPDEPMLNLLGTALFVADESNPPDRRVLDDAIGFYSQRSMDMEKTHPGQRRWGIQWLSEDDAKTQFDAYNKAIDAYQESVRMKTAADTHVKDLQDALHGNGPRVSQKDVNAAKSQAASAVTAIKAAKAAIPRPPWLTDVQPVVPTIDPAMLALAAGPTTAPSPSSPSSLAPAPSASTPAPNPPTPTPTPAPGSATPASPPALAIVPPPAPEARYAAAFPVDRTHLVTASDPIGTATQVMIEDTRGGVMPAKVVATSGKLALLEVTPADAGGPLKYLPLATDFTGGPVQCAAIPQANLFGPTVTMLTADAPVPLKSVWWVSLSDHPRLAGSPLLDAQNEVIGVEVATRDDARQRIPAVTLDDLRKFLQSNHIVPASSPTTPDPTVVSQVAVESE
jgi:hypothetical protein